MSRSVWSPNRMPRPEPCDALAPLLSPYADGAATEGESRRVEAHLIGCDSCRETLFWMQATHRTLAARPVALPPADLHSRIASAIAASEAAPVSLRPVSLRPARVFALRPAYAAAASLTLLGIVLSYPLWHTPAHSVKPVLPPVQTASKPAVVKSSPVALPHLPTGKLPQAQVAANNPHDVPETVKSAAVVKRLAAKRVLAPRVSLPSEQVANAVKAPDVPHVAPLSVKTPPKAPLRYAPAPQKMASSHVQPGVTKSVPHLPSPVKETLKVPDTVLVAKVPPVHIPDAVQVHILPATVEHDPPVKVADSIMGTVRARVNQMHTVAYAVPAQSVRGAVNMMHTVHALDSEHTAYVDGIHSP